VGEALGRLRPRKRPDPQPKSAALKLESYKECYDESCQVAVGKELAAQQTINTRIIEIANVCTVSIAIFDLRLEASVFARNAEGGCSENALLGLIREALGGVAASVAEPEPEEPSEASPVAITTLILDSDPEGAEIIVNGERQDQRTPAALELTVGTHVIELKKVPFFARQKVTLTEGQLERLKVDLDETVYGQMRISTQSPKATVRIGDKILGVTPLITAPIPAGKTEFTFSVDPYKVSRTAVDPEGRVGKIDLRLQHSLATSEWMILGYLGGGGGSSINLSTPTPFRVTTL
jgi:hypothetical protein